MDALAFEQATAAVVMLLLVTGCTTSGAMGTSSVDDRSIAATEAPSPAGQDVYYELQDGIARLWYHPDRWTRTDQAEFRPYGVTFRGAKSVFFYRPDPREAMVAVFTTPIKLNVEEWLGRYVAALRKSYSQVEVVARQQKSVNGEQVSLLTFSYKLTADDAETYVIKTLIWSGDAGLVQLMAVTQRQFMDAYEPAFDELFDGFITRAHYSGGPVHYQ